MDWKTAMLIEDGLVHEKDYTVDWVARAKSDVELIGTDTYGRDKILQGGDKKTTTGISFKKGAGYGAAKYSLSDKRDMALYIDQFGSQFELDPKVNKNLQGLDPIKDKQKIMEEAAFTHYGKQLEDAIDTEHKTSITQDKAKEWGNKNAWSPERQGAEAALLHASLTRTLFYKPAYKTVSIDGVEHQVPYYINVDGERKLAVYDGKMIIGDDGKPLPAQKLTNEERLSLIHI